MTLRIVNPATGALLRELETTTADQVAHALAGARAAQGAWATRPAEQRAAVVRAFAGLLQRKLDALAAIQTSETGKPISQAKNEIRALGARIDFFLENVPKVQRTEPVHSEPGLTERITYEPLGVVGNISAWNYPWFVGGNVFLPALLTGNAVLYKPSEVAALTGQAIGELWREAGLPDGVFTTLVGAGETGRALLESKLDGLFFTGSYATGRRVADAARAHMIPVGLELGGKDPAYVTDDVDVANAAAGLADGAFYNAGQSCCAVERIYVHERVYDAFVDAFVAEVKRFVVGDPTDEATYLGPLARPAQIEVLAAQIADATSKGARVLLGGQRRAGGGAYFEPTVLVDVNHDMTLMKEESFGPIIGIQKVSGDADATELMQDTEYGLTAGVYCRDLARAEVILQHVSAGSAYINCCDRVSPRLPWSGRGHSGLGSTLGVAGIHAFVRPKAWHVRG